MSNFSNYRRDGFLQRLVLDHGSIAGRLAPLDPNTAQWAVLDVWERINAQVRQWQADVDAYARALPISQQDEPEPQTFTDAETGNTRENPEWRRWKDASDTVANASADTIALYEARTGVQITDPETEESYLPNRQMVVEWPSLEAGSGEIYTASFVVEDRTAKATLTVAVGDATRLQAEADALKPAAKAAVRAAAQAQLEPILSTYTEPERLSWGPQLEQARAFKADNAAVTPLLDTLASQRGLTRDQLADKVITKAEQFQTATGQVVGAQHAAEDAIDAATTPNTVLSVREAFLG